ncbi:MAG TPA: hypothetical protein VN456_10070 [Desulfosporosinus sp.]|nr:hypothetical protein [Desulfosporosinus sp.]
MGIDFCPFFAQKPQHLVVKVPQLSPKPHFVIRIILSTCLEETKKMPVKPGIPLAPEYVPEKIASGHGFFQAPLSAFCKFSAACLHRFLGNTAAFLCFTIRIKL